MTNCEKCNHEIKEVLCTSCQQKNRAQKSVKKRFAGKSKEEISAIMRKVSLSK